MTKQEMIREAQEKLAAEKLEKEKQKVLTEIREVEKRLESAKDRVRISKLNAENALSNLEKEQTAADKYIETGDYDLYKKELNIVEPTCVEALSDGSLTFVTPTYGSVLTYNN